MTKVLNVIDDWLAGAALAGCFGTVSLELISRDVFGYSFIWSEELSRYLLICLTYFGAAGAAREGLHIRVEFILDRLKKRTRTVIEIITHILCSCFCGVMVLLGFRLVRDSYNLGMMSADSTLALPIWVFQAVVPVGFFLMTIRLMIKAWLSFLDSKLNVTC